MIVAENQAIGRFSLIVKCKYAVACYQQQALAVYLCKAASNTTRHTAVRMQSYVAWVHTIYHNHVHTYHMATTQKSHGAALDLYVMTCIARGVL